MSRTLVLWCPDWPVVTALREAGLRTSLAAAVFTANRVQACTAAARSDGVTVGLRRREAQSRCPELVVLKADQERDAREFERVAVAAEALAPGLEVLRPGLLACPVRGPARYFRSEVKAAEVLVDTVEALGVECRIGVADSLEVAVLAARVSALVPVGGSTEFCAPLAIGVLAAEPSIAGDERPELVDLLVRLGLTTLGAYASLPETKVGTRFGADGVLAHRLARGLGERAVSRRHIPPDLTTRQLCDPPLDRVDTAAFAASALAETFHQRLAAADLSCTRLAIGATTELGRELTRTWRCASPLTPAATADRLRWQLDGWLSSSPGAITSLTLEPVEAIGAGRIQFGLWGSEGEGDQRAGWALARVQGLLGPESVLVPALSGGSDPAQRISLIPWGQERSVPRDPAAPWPGSIPAPSPTRVAAGTVARDSGARPPGRNLSRSPGRPMAKATVEATPAAGRRCCWTTTRTWGSPTAACCPAGRTGSGWTAEAGCRWSAGVDRGRSTSAGGTRAAAGDPGRPWRAGRLGIPSAALDHRARGPGSSSRSSTRRRCCSLSPATAGRWRGSTTDCGQARWYRLQVTCSASAVPTNSVHA